MYSTTVTCFIPNHNTIKVEKFLILAFLFLKKDC